MRKFKLQVQVTVDGYMGGPSGEMGWVTVPWTDDASATLTESPWENAVVRGGDLAEIVNELKDQPGGDMIAYGGSTLVSNLIAENLLDELNLFVNPAAIGAGLPVFPNLDAHQKLRLVNAQGFECGIAALHLEPERS